jgi:hypothetical protein
MREFCPGNVSRRAATDEQFAAHWVPVPDLDVDEIQSIDPADHYGSLVVERHDRRALLGPLLRPGGLHGRQPRPAGAAARIHRRRESPDGPEPLQSCLPHLALQLRAGRDRSPVDLPSMTPLAGLTSMAYHLHAERAYVRTVRAVIGTDGSALLDGTERRYRTRLQRSRETPARSG